MGGRQFVSYLAQKKPLVDAWLSEHAWTRAEDASADLDGYLYEPLARFTAGGGKRVRPVLALLGCEAVGAAPERALAAGCAIELFQSAALIHDDIADKSELRRGERCLHLTHGTGLALNVGDAALIEASCAILEDPLLDDGTRLKVLDAFLTMERRTIEGQALDLGWVRDNRWDADYLEMATLKTAYYSCASPLAIGALCGGADEDQIRVLEAFGLDAGLAFQLQDDLLNLTGDAAKQGKDFMSDIAEGKRTLAVTHALEALEGDARTELISILEAGTTDRVLLARAVDLLDQAGALAYVRDLAHSMVARAADALAQAAISSDARATLASMADYFVERTG
ncbi:polyprenyl synthetase family protein [Coriobacteriales bacterium OH1046]|nr:polyprenyl synthetase family protein [Coriobacteriales bacterium OH1046]